MPLSTTLRFLRDTLGANAVTADGDTLKRYASDYTECPPSTPGVIVWPSTTAEVQAVVRHCVERRLPLTARVLGSNVGGLAIPAAGGLVLDMSRMTALEVDADNMIVSLQPGVSQAQVKAALAPHPLTIGYNLGPPEASLLANALSGGLTNRSLKYGDTSEWLTGLEVVLYDGSVARLGGLSVNGAPPTQRGPLPDLLGLFVNWQGTTGIVTRGTMQVYPKHALNRRYFVLCGDESVTFAAMRRLVRLEMLEDVGGMSWPAGRRVLGVHRPHVEPAEGEPRFFLYIDLAADTEAEMDLKFALLSQTLREVAATTGGHLEAPLDVRDLVELSPDLGKFADFPTRLDFLTDHPGGGLTWVGTLGPGSRIAEAARAGMALMAQRGEPPMVVTRAMKGGHHYVLRFVTLFDKADPARVEAVRALNRELFEVALAHGFVMYKTPDWAWRALWPHVDGGAQTLLARVRALMDPAGLFNPDRLPMG